MSLPQLQNPNSARIAATCTIIGPLMWWSLEYWTSRGYKPSYSYLSNFTSDLAVPYPFAERTWNRQAESTRHYGMKFCFLAKAALAAIGHFSLIRATGKRDVLTVARAFFAVVYACGITLVGLVPGGEREHENGMVFWHSLGAMGGFMSGNICSILGGLASPDPTYRKASVTFGVAGIVNTVIFIIMGRTKVRGLWQRAAINSIQAWEIMTSFSLLSQLSNAASSRPVLIKQA